MAKIGNNARFFFRHNEAGGNSVELKPKIFPNSKTLAHVLRSVVNIELGIIERIGHQGGRQVMDAVPHVREHGQHGRKRHFAVAAHIVDQQKLLGVVHLSPLTIQTPLRRRDCLSVAHDAYGERIH